MRLSTIQVDEQELAAVHRGDGSYVTVREVAPELPANLFGLLEAGALDALARMLQDSDDADLARRARPLHEVTYRPLYRTPRKLWGIGLNYRAHAGDLSAPLPEEPASFIKGSHTIIGPGETIELPPQSQRVTAEAELGVVIGRTCRNVEEDEALSYVAGFCNVLDQTAEDILERNPRFLTRSKNFPTFFSFGPVLVTTDEFLAEVGSLAEVSVTTVHNGAVHRQNLVSSMIFSPEHLISFHSKVMPLFPGDVISTGTPGAVVIEDGDVAECRIDAIGTLTNPVRRAGD